MEKSKKKFVGVYVDEKTYEWVKAIAEDRECSMTSVIRLIVKRKMEECNGKNENNI